MGTVPNNLVSRTFKGKALGTRLFPELCCTTTLENILQFYGHFLKEFAFT